MIITKYFDPKDWDKYAEGSFKIGTLEEYRSSEADLARMSDRNEGISVEGIGAEWTVLNKLQYRGEIVAENIEMYGSPKGAMIVEEFNEHVFCASEGSYERSHHEKMLFGEKFADGSAYLGNSDLLAYVEIDLKNLISGFCFWIAKNAVVSSELGIFEIIRSYTIQYGHRELAMNVMPKLTHAQSGSLEARFSTMLIKPEVFRTEREIRVWVGLNFPNSLKLGASALYPSSSRLKRSIVSMGLWDQ